ncbi:GNAT family N-acetyltransferase [Nocardioides sp. GY 10127]|uniref:GNAT family N-acetyltransferase n=1 Tax=Nocardioides sp. GY 10127 TaxID=2569762 RepID=UPI0010A8FFDB|nr:GNAT family N-acetyltransferase [Nocardioides sp. GY 10127]TIC84349.1 GNAT family N-acetyltransferase [Nocardioides sp. GY 10127]
MTLLWRVRASLPDRPGALAALAQRCAEAGVDIRRVQVFPGNDEVTDELVLATDDTWSETGVADLVTSSGWHHLTTQSVTEAALTDQPTRFVQAARSILARPNSFPEVVAQLFDAETEPRDDDGPPLDSMEMTVGDVQVQVRRPVPFTDIERARGLAMADLVSDVLQRSKESAAIAASSSHRRLGSGATPSFLPDGDSVSAVVDGAVVGLATVQDPLAEEDDVRPVALRVDAGWQRRGIGTRLLVDAGRIARGLGANEIVLTTRSDNQAVLPMVLAAGLRGRIRMAGDVLTVRVPVRDLKPLV